VTIDKQSAAPKAFGADQTPAAWVSASPWRTIGLGAVLVLAVFLAYLPSMDGGFVCDDTDDVVNNLALRSWDGLVALWTQPGVTAQYYPLSFSTFWLNYQLGGLNPFGYHLVNVLLHAINALLLWRVLHRLMIPGACLAAGLFALHPVQAESVAYISERKNVLSGFFFFCALLAAIKFWLPESTKQEKNHSVAGGAASKESGSLLSLFSGLSSLMPSSHALLLERFASWYGANVGIKFRIKCERWPFYALTVLLYLCALASKTAVLPLPAVILLIIWWRRRPTVRDVAFLSPLALAGLAMGLITVHLENYLIAVAKLWTLSWPERYLIAARDIWFYLGKLIWPHPLIFTYPRWTVSTSDWIAYLPVLALATGIWILWRHRHGWGRPCFFALAYFVALLFLTLGFFDLNMFRFTFVSDHFQYLACIGPLTLASAGIITVWNRFGRGINSGVLPVLAFVLLLIMGVLTWQQSATYANAETLWRTTLSKNPDCAMAEVGLGDCYFKENRIDEALELNRRATRLDPKFYEAWNNLGNILAAKGLSDQAMDCYRQALQINPSYKNSLVVFATLLNQSGKFDEAIAVYDGALKHNVDEPEIFSSLAWLLATCPDAKFRDGKRAVALAEHACQLTRYTEPIPIRTLSAAYAEAGRFTNAIASVTLAEQLFTQRGMTAPAVKNLQMLQLYEAGKPYHEPAPAPQPTPSKPAGP